MTMEFDLSGTAHPTSQSSFLLIRVDLKMGEKRAAVVTRINYLLAC